MRLVFFGTGLFAVPALKALAAHCELVVTQPNRPSGRGMRERPSPVRFAAEEIGLKVEAPVKSRSPEFAQRLREIKPDALLVASYGQILSQELLDSAARGGINLHASLLPKYRGAAPIQRAILNGESETGVTIMQMDRGMDTGDVIGMEKVAVGADETYGELQDRLAGLAADMAVQYMPRIVLGDYPRTPQDHSVASLAPKVDKAEAELSFQRSADAEYLRFRAFTPNPGVVLRTKHGLWRVSKARLIQAEGLQGHILQTRPSFIIAFSSGAIELIEAHPEGRKRMSGQDLANGLRLKKGDSLV